MPELPEISLFARDMQVELVGRTIRDVEVLQPKCLNLPVDEFRIALSGSQIQSVSSHGKWLQVKTTRGWLLFNLGMGGEILLTDRDHLPEKHRLIFDLADGVALVVNFWWLGHAHHIMELADHRLTASLGPDFMSLSLDDFRALLQGRRGGHQVHPAQPEAYGRYRQCVRPGPAVQGGHPPAAAHSHVE